MENGMKKRERKIEISIWFSISSLGKLTKKIRKNTPGSDSSIIVCFYADFWAKELGTSFATQSQLLGRQNLPLNFKARCTSICSMESWSAVLERYLQYSFTTLGLISINSNITHDNLLIPILCSPSGLGHFYSIQILVT